MSLCDRLGNAAAGEAPSDTRERIMAAAVAVFSGKGFQRASLDEIAAEAGLTKGAIYWHFRSKNDLFSALLEDRFQRHTAPFSAELALALGNGDTAQRQQAVAMLMRDILRRFQDDANWPRLFLEFLSQSRDPDIAARMRQLIEHGRGLARQMVEQMKQAGLTDPALDTDMLAVFWCALIDGFMMAWVVKPETFAADALVEGLVGMLWSGMAPRS